METPLSVNQRSHHAFTSWLTAALALLAIGCDEERCRYTSRCVDGELKTCVEGFENGGERTADYASPGCDAPNPLCVELDDDHAACVVAASPTCEADAFAETCEGAIATRCLYGYRVAEDCSVHGNTCGVVEGAALCARAPLTRCDPQTFAEQCAGGAVAVLCETGVVERLDCEVTSPGSACALSPPERERRAYCD